MRSISRAHLSGATTPILVISFAIDIIILSMSKETKRKETKKRKNIRTLTCCFLRVI